MVRDHGVEGVAKLLAHRRITSIAELRDGLTSDRLPVGRYTYYTEW